MGLTATCGFIVYFFLWNRNVFMGVTFSPQKLVAFAPCKTRLEASFALKLSAHFANMLN